MRLFRFLIFSRIVILPFRLLKVIYIYILLTLIQFRKKKGFMRSSALAYSLLFAVIPLIASLSLFMNHLYKLNKLKIQLFLNQQEVNAFILKILPYTSEEINQYIASFAGNAMTVGWIGTGIFIITLVLLVDLLIDIFNVTWNVPEPRPYHRRLGLITFIIIFFTAVFSLSVRVQGFILEQNLIIKIPGRIFSFFLLSFAFSILYERLPRAQVKKRAALMGGILAAAFYEIGRIIFKYFISETFAYSKLYGSLSILPVFIVSLLMLALIIILGSEMSFTTQNFSQLYQELQYQREQKKMRKRSRA
ncbi:MAG: hypothetical protein A2268_04565 [Candidatus Raymondbacteria bacterium RifOxyA12_full_50_37]|nr:MAG: hypothetical protein A2268_04565 [Candidatus Raymondbacteria bacterium RifOxyA12_full_50_37]OGJ94024.1 MAG: hypothetical protein A2248_11765 [Candidatus Raymondbacteria bacterium RIFOXYA2_FULL_49_16]OGJ96850.1 MAG: hypothetical protein A2453_04370 [Candidatus Raymondbacteria bacterium RIFOXYC2_FULL_50_21]OGP41772.1 MAG: hypothetical protein A2324_18140 [Candidatus Raymondbacteria bacterium RIFOXYB2_FULL_49_35]